MECGSVFMEAGEGSEVNVGGPEELAERVAVLLQILMGAMEQSLSDGGTGRLG
jgi:hypothetical protein